jgi:hypothetical protein
MSSKFWRNVHGWTSEKALRSDARTVLKIVGEFLKPCGNQTQVSCPFSSVLGFSHWKAKIGWLCGARQMQKNVSLRSRQVKKTLLQLGQDLKPCRYLGLWVKSKVAELTAWIS